MGCIPLSASLQEFVSKMQGRLDMLGYGDLSPPSFPFHFSFDLEDFFNFMILIHCLQKVFRPSGAPASLQVRKFVRKIAKMKNTEPSTKVATVIEFYMKTKKTMELSKLSKLTS